MAIDDLNRTRFARPGSDTDKCGTLIDDFTQELESSESFDLVAWALEVPSELRDRVIPIYLDRYLCDRQRRGWTTYLAGFIEQFPQYARFVDRFREAARDDRTSGETRPAQQLSATTTYEVEPTPWREGGQGSLHKASDQGVGGRQVVIKFLKAADLEQDFRKEIEITAKLEHPGVVPVFARGVEATPPNRSFFAMRLIHGKPLEELIADFYNNMGKDPKRLKAAFSPGSKSPMTAIVENLISACNTASYAHSVGVLHCDIKPKNIVCGRFGATHLVDWGSAQRIAGGRDTADDSSVPLDFESGTGKSYTLSHASPEQLLHQELTPASDVFALGATLYHAITGQPPYGHGRRRDSEAIDVRNVNPCVPPRLAAICQKAMHRDPAQRYASADGLGADLTNWLRDEEVEAVPDTLLGSSFRFARHHQRESIVALVGLLSLLLLGSLTWMIRARAMDSSKSLDASLSLIENLCEPLQNDSVANSDEFDVRAKGVEDFAAAFIRESRDRDTKLARAHQLAGLVAFYHHNRQLSGDSKAQLVRAIESLEAAEAIFSSSGQPLAQARNVVRRARWLQQLALSSDNLEKEVVAAYRALEVADRLLAADESKSARALLAEISQIRGELLLKYADDVTSVGAADIAFDTSLPPGVKTINLKQSARCFDNTIDILKAAGPGAGRELARGYGYRGDVHQQLDEIELAFQDYTDSLRIRKMQFDAAPTDENRFQLARGYANFGNLTVNASEESLRTLESSAFMTQFHAELDQINAASRLAKPLPIEVLVCETCTGKAIDLQRELVFNRTNGDERATIDFLRSCDRAAELHYFAALRDKTSEADRRKYLDKADSFLDEAIRCVDVAGSDVEAMPQYLHDRLAACYTLKLEIVLARGDSQPGVLKSLSDKVRTLVGVVESPQSKDIERLQLLILALAAVDDEVGVRQGLRQLAAQKGSRSVGFKKHVETFLSLPGHDAVDGELDSLL